VAGAVIAVPTTAFVQSQQVSKAAVRVTREMAASAPLTIAAPVAPTQKSIRGDTGQGNKPPAQVFERPVVARTAPPASQPGFAAQQQQLNAKQGKPLDEAARKEMKPAAAAPAPAVRVVAPTPAAAPPTGQPLAPTPDTSPADARGKSEEPRAKPEQRGKPEQREQRAAEPKTVTPPVVAPAPVAPPAPAAQPARPERKAPPAARHAEPPAQTPEPAAARQPAAPPAAQPAQPTQPKANADKGKGQARDKAKTAEELLLEEEELLRKRRNQKK
jgi:hypothetical protein